MADDRAGPIRGLRLHLLVLRCQAGDDGAFEDLYAEFGPRTSRYLASLVGDFAADDIQQEVWLTVYRRISSLADPARFRTWLFAAARNRAIDWLRRVKRESLLFDEDAAGLVDETAPATDSTGARSFDDEDVRAAMAALPPAHREVLLLRYRNEMSYAEIGLVTGCPIGTVRSRLHHARNALEQQLAVPDRAPAHEENPK